MDTMVGRYLAYMLRIWKENDAGMSTWRASVEDPHSGERRGFPNLDALITFLWGQVQDLQDETKVPQDNEGS